MTGGTLKYPKRRISVSWKDILVYRSCPRKLALKFMGVKLRSVQRSKKTDVVALGVQGEVSVVASLLSLREGKSISEDDIVRLARSYGKVGERIEYKTTLNLARRIRELLNNYIEDIDNVFTRVKLKSSVAQTYFKPDLVFTSEKKTFLVEVKNTANPSKEHRFQALFYKDVVKMAGTTIIFGRKEVSMLEIDGILLVYPRLHKILLLEKEEKAVKPFEIGDIYKVKFLALREKLPKEKGLCSRCQYRKMCVKYSHRSLDEFFYPPEMSIAQKVSQRFGKTFLDEVFWEEKIDVSWDDFQEIMVKEFMLWNIDFSEVLLPKNEDGKSKIIKDVLYAHTYPRNSYNYVVQATRILEKNTRRELPENQMSLDRWIF